MDDMVLIHYGVKGQKWGVRNYQNPDGSYKPGAEGRYDQYEWKEVKVTQVPDFLKNGNNEVLNYNATYRTRVKKKRG